jgi:L-aspartate oxidase
MRTTGRPHVWLDMRTIDAGRFPNVVSSLQQAGLDPTTELVPISPAAHYVMGGVVTDLDGATTVPGLYAVGESACTGLHGANRLASNSLTECFVFGQRAAEAALGEPSLSAPGPAPEPVAIAMPSRETREHLWRDAGLVRDADGLRTLLDDPHPLARVVGECALLREESRGGHQRSDFPATDSRLDGFHVVIRAGDAPEFESWV